MKSYDLTDHTGTTLMAGQSAIMDGGHGDDSEGIIIEKDGSLWFRYLDDGDEVEITKHIAQCIEIQTPLSGRTKEPEIHFKLPSNTRIYEGMGEITACNISLYGVEATSGFKHVTCNKCRGIMHTPIDSWPFKRPSLTRTRETHQTNPEEGK